MTGKRGKREPPLSLDMSFNEAFARFVQTSLPETEELERLTSQKRKAAGLSPAASLSEPIEPSRPNRKRASRPIDAAS